MKTTIIKGQLEIDRERGVIYFHADEEAIKKWPPTPLRICRLPKPIPEGLVSIDLTHMVGCHYERRR